MLAVIATSANLQYCQLFQRSHRQRQGKDGKNYQAVDLIDEARATYGSTPEYLQVIHP